MNSACRYTHARFTQRIANYRLWPSGKPSAYAFWRNAPAVLFITFAILATGVFARECPLSSRTRAFVQAIRFLCFLFVAIAPSLPLANYPAPQAAVGKGYDGDFPTLLASGFSQSCFVIDIAPSGITRWPEASVLSRRDRLVTPPATHLFLSSKYAVPVKPLRPRLRICVAVALTPPRATSKSNYPQLNIRLSNCKLHCFSLSSRWRTFPMTEWGADHLDQRHQGGGPRKVRCSPSRVVPSGGSCIVCARARAPRSALARRPFRAGRRVAKSGHPSRHCGRSSILRPASAG
jgi:hypothetical protein